jgi:hypothetical protein
MAEKGDFTPAFVRSQIDLVSHAVAVSFYNDCRSSPIIGKLCVSTLLDKMRLYTDLIPGVTQVRANNPESQLAVILGKAFKRTTHLG